jgi:TolB-like protein
MSGWRGLALLAGLQLAVAAAAQAAPVRVAFLSVDNLSANPRYDYLEGIIRGILLFDLSGAEGVEVVNRGDLDSILREQELQLSSLSADTGKAVEVGRILRADYLLRGEYVFLGQEVLVSAHLLDVFSSRTLSFTARGATENTIHDLAEQILFRLTGRELALQSPQHERSIISLQDEKPGAIGLFSHLIDAEIYVDGKFLGYTTGDARLPYEITGLSPGKHRVRIRLPGFGVIKEPEITFADWEQEIEVPAGQRVVVRAQARSFNEQLYRLQQLVREEIRERELAGGQTVRREHDGSFTDREGHRVPIRIAVEGSQTGETIRFLASVSYDGEERSFDLSGPAGENRELRQVIGKVEVILEVDGGDLSYEIWRRDIEQNMFR